MQPAMQEVSDRLKLLPDMCTLEGVQREENNSSGQNLGTCSISVLILTLNAGKKIHPLLEVLKQQSVPLDIVVVDSSSTDGTPSLARAGGARVVTVRRNDFDHGTTRNLGLLHVSGDIVVFLTQDAIPAGRQAIERLIAPFFADEQVGCAYGRQLPAVDATIFAEHLRLFNYGRTSFVKSRENRELGIKTPFMSNSFAAYRREALEDVGLFKEDLIFAEDTYAGARLLMAGYKIAYVADAAVYHSHNYTILEEFQRYFDIGVFHRKEKWITETFGRAEGEGGRYVLSELRHLARKRKYHLLPEFVARNCFKYLGFALGQKYERIPLKVVERISRNKNYWKKIKGQVNIEVASSDGVGPGLFVQRDDCRKQQAGAKSAAVVQDSR